MKSTTLTVHASSGLEPIGCGASGFVMQGRVDGDEGQLVAIKTFSSCEDSVAASKSEASVYRHLKDLQGVVIPTFLGTGQVPLTGTGFLLTSLVEGKPLSSITCLDPRKGKEVAEAARQALSLIHKHGVAHGDVRLQNILLLDEEKEERTNGQDLGRNGPPLNGPRIMILDFAQSFLAQEMTLQAEMKQLDYMFRSWLKS